MIYLSLPLLYKNYNFNRLFTEYCKKYSHHLKYQIKIHDVHGCFPFSSWNGGANSNFDVFPTYPDYHNFANDTQQKIRLDCSNIYLDDKDVFDRHQNAILMALDKPNKNLIEFSNLIVYDYVDSTYENFLYVLSNNANNFFTLSNDFINGILENKKIILVNLDEKDYSFFDNKEKIEATFLNPCQNCPKALQVECKRKENINQLQFSAKSFLHNCPKLSLYDLTYLGYDEERFNKIIDNGITHIKIAEPPIFAISDFNKYLINLFVKQEYLNEWSFIIMIDYALPGLYEHYKLNISLLLFKEQYPNYFYDNIDFSCVYGSFYFCSWDGGRVFDTNHLHASKELIEELVNVYNYRFQIPMRFTFTNPILTEEDCYDRFNNMVLSVCNNGYNEIVVNSPILEEYLRQTFPNYRYISSTTKCLDKNEQKNELNKDYYMVCLDYNHNKNFEFLNSLNKDEKEKTEFLVNALCPSNCKMRKSHYALNGQFVINYGKPYVLKGCPILGSSLKPEACDITNNISVKEIEEKYVPLGFSHFKLEGRSLSDIEVLCHYAKYFIKPEYQLITVTLIGQVMNHINLYDLDNVKFEMLPGEMNYGKNN